MAGYKPAVIVVTVLGFCAWVVALAGISVITNDAYKNYLGTGIYSGPLDLGMNVVRGLQFQWWGVWFEFIVLCFVAGFAATRNLQAHQATLTGLLATVTAVNMINSRVFLDYAPTNYVRLVATRKSGLNCAAAGYIMFCTFNMFLVLLLGSGLVWLKEAEYSSSAAGKGVGAGVGGVGLGGPGATRGPGPNFAQPTTFAAPLSSGGARTYLPQHQPTVTTTTIGATH